MVVLKATTSVKISFCGFAHIYILSSILYGDNICDHAGLRLSEPPVHKCPEHL